jgi:hypothetical protein
MHAMNLLFQKSHFSQFPTKRLIMDEPSASNILLKIDWTRTNRILYELQVLLNPDEIRVYQAGYELDEYPQVLVTDWISARSTIQSAID